MRGRTSCTNSLLDGVSLNACWQNHERYTEANKRQTHRYFDTIEVFCCHSMYSTYGFTLPFASKISQAIASVKFSVDLALAAVQHKLIYLCCVQKYAQALAMHWPSICVLVKNICKAVFQLSTTFAVGPLVAVGLSAYLQKLIKGLTLCE